MAEGRKEPEENVDYTIVIDCRESDDEWSQTGLRRNFSFEDGSALQEKVQRLEKELESVATHVGTLMSMSNDRANEETRARRREGRSVAQLMTEIDAMKKELWLREQSEESLRQQLRRALAKAAADRAAMAHVYEEKVALLKQKIEKEANQFRLRLIDQLELETRRVSSLVEPNGGRITREVHFVVRRVPNNDIVAGHQPHPRSHYMSCFSCKEPYLTDEQTDEACHYHPLPAMKKATWERDWEVDVDPKKYQNYRYWACCNTLARKRPAGCCRGRHHQKWEVDILLKKAMEPDQWNTTTMLERSISKVIIITD